MNRCDRSITREDHRYQNRRQQRENHPSFSSTLLDAIYRSIDEGGGGRGEGEEEELVLYRETMRKTRSSSANCAAVKVGGGGGGWENEEDMARLQRACLIEKWMEKKVSDKVVLRRKSVAATVADFHKSSSSSSDSSSGGGFSSSEAESVHLHHKPKPIRTSVSADPVKFNKHGKNDHNVFDKSRERKINDASSLENRFVKTKSKAMKIYGDLKKVKQPISPGGKLASFLNSLFTAGGAKKAKISSSSVDETKSKSAYASTCSSASSFSRSCLSKTPSSRGKPSNGMKRSVRFCPVSVIVGEDCQPCGQKTLYKDEMKVDGRNSMLTNSVNEEIKFHIMEKNRRVEEAARDLLKNYQKKVEYEFNMRNVEGFGNDDEDEEEDDDASCASSDLFELDNLSAIGIERYREELPVYETTHLDTNRAIASGLIV